MSRSNVDRGTVMMAVGLALALVSAATMVWGPDEATGAVVVGIIGIVFIAVGSRNRGRHAL